MARFNDDGQPVIRSTRKNSQKRARVSLLTITLDNYHIIPDLLEGDFPRFTFFIRTGVAYRGREYASITGGASLAFFEPPRYRKRADRVLHKLVALIWSSYYMAKYHYICNILQFRSFKASMKGRRYILLDWYLRVTGERLPTGSAWLIKIHTWVRSVSRLANGIKRWRHAFSWAHTDKQIGRLMQEARRIGVLLEDFVTPTRIAYCTQIEEGLLVGKQNALRDALEHLLAYWAADMSEEMERQLAAQNSHAHPSRPSSSGPSSDPLLSGNAHDENISLMSYSLSPQSSMSLFSTPSPEERGPSPQSHQHNTARPRDAISISETDGDSYPCSGCNFIDCDCRLDISSEGEGEDEGIA
jgi:hypothetical protein